MQQCIAMFHRFAKEAFNSRIGSKLPWIKYIVETHHHSRYRSRGLNQVLKQTFGDSIMFGEPRPITQTKVAITMARAGKRPLVLTNYNRGPGNERVYTSLDHCLGLIKLIIIDLTRTRLRLFTGRKQGDGDESVGGVSNLHSCLFSGNILTIHLQSTCNIRRTSLLQTFPPSRNATGLSGWGTGLQQSSNSGRFRAETALGASHSTRFHIVDWNWG